MPASTAQFSEYKKVDVQTASQGKLIVMLFNGAIQRAEEAKRQLEKGRYEGVHNNLIRAQDIIGELRNALDMKAGEVAGNLDRLYEYFQHLLIKANIRKEPGPAEEAVALMTELRDTWKELFQKLDAEGEFHPPQVNQHGAAVMNIEG
ncbi:MAG: flagellar export chaperone FliS [Candidatus Hydrogenedentes bacterium]|nr:flagellar export chaperone FliS [Candidatus Hydrogenedentota bacterium]